MNISLAKKVLEELGRWGVRDLVLCSGARNSPFVSLLSESEGFRIHPFFEERSAAFYALGKIKRFGRPVAVLTTSGTAVAELLPATMEAHFSGLPLILVTADRPKRFRGTGAPQTAEQAGLFNHYVEAFWDLEMNQDFSIPRWSLLRPLQINVCFEEPLIDEPVAKTMFTVREEPVRIPTSPMLAEQQHQLLSFFIHCKKPLVIVGGLNESDRPHVLKFLTQLKAPIYAEAQSGLREAPELQNFMILSGEKTLRQPAVRDVMDGILRVGSVPTLRLWRDLETMQIPVCHLSAQGFPGLTHGRLIFGDIGQIMNIPAPRSQWTTQQLDALSDQEKRTRLTLDKLLQQFPNSEPGLIRKLSQVIPEKALVYLGNSLPIREWDLAADTKNRGFEMSANRGVNGIDGLISTFMGSLSYQHSNWLIIGDLTAMYDLAGLWPHHLNQLAGDNQLDWKIVVINNGGGKIFDRMFRNKLFENQHQITFGKWAEMWSVPYAQIRDLPIQGEIPRQAIIEILPNPSATESFWNAYEGIFPK